MSSGNRRWRFFRAGGFDQVRLDEADDLLAIDALDQKLWVALSCPVTGVQFDESTLAFIDADADGHVRAYELIAAVRWAAERLVDPQLLGGAQDGLAPDDIRLDTEAGQNLAAAARTLAEELGKTEHEGLSVAEVSTAQARHAARALAAWEAAGTESAPIASTRHAASAPHAAIFARNTATAARSRSINTARAAPRDNASNPNAPVPAKTSATPTPSITPRPPHGA